MASDKIIVKIGESNIKIKISEPNIFVKTLIEKIVCNINDTPGIRIKIFDDPEIKIRLGSQGLRGRDGDNTDHSLLSHLDYATSGHTDFQKKLTYVTEYKAYSIE